MLSNVAITYLLSERKKAAVHIQGIAFTVARLKIVHATKNFITYSMAEFLEELSSFFFRIKRHSFHDSY